MMLIARYLSAECGTKKRTTKGYLVSNPVLMTYTIKTWIKKFVLKHTMSSSLSAIILINDLPPTPRCLHGIQEVAQHAGNVQIGNHDAAEIEVA